MRRSDWSVSLHERTVGGGVEGHVETHTTGTSHKVRMVCRPFPSADKSRNSPAGRDLRTYGVSGSRSETARTNLSRRAHWWPRPRPRTSYLSSPSLLLTHDLCLPTGRSTNERKISSADPPPTAKIRKRLSRKPPVSCRLLPRPVHTTLFTDEPIARFEVLGGLRTLERQTRKRLESRAKNGLRCLENTTASDCQKKKKNRIKTVNFRFSFDLCLVIVGLYITIIIIINTFR